MAVGTAFIQVIPDLKGFHQRARQDLAKENLTATVDLKPEMDTAAARKEVNQTAKSMGRVSVQFTANLDSGAARAQAETAATQMRHAVPFTADLQTGTSQAQAETLAAGLRRNVPFAVDLQALAARPQADATAVGLRRDVPFAVDLQSLAARPQADASALALRRNVPFNIDLDTGAAQIEATMAAASMHRSVTFNVDVDRNVLGQATAAVTSGATQMAGSGMMVGSSFTRVGLIIATLGPLIVALVGVAAAAIMALPALIGAVAAPIAAIALGIDGIKAAAASVAPAFAPIQAAVSATFQAGLLPVFQALTALVPILQAGLVGTAGALVGMAASMAGLLTSAQGMAWLSQLFAGINGLIVGLTPAMTMLVGSFLQLAAAAIGPLSVGLIGAVTAFAQMFGQMIQQITASGLLAQSMTLLGQTLGVLLMILPPLLQAGLQMFMIFGPAMNQAFLALIPALAPIGQLLGVITQLFFTLLAALIPVIAALVTALMPVLFALMPVITTLAMAIGGFLVQALMILSPLLQVIGTLLAAVLMPVINAMLPVLFALLTPLLWIAQVLVAVLLPVIQFLTPALQVLAPVIGVLVGLYIAWQIWTYALAAAQWALNLAFLANPITWIIIGIIALVAAVIYAWQNFAWFRDIVMACWAGITIAAQWAWSILGIVFGWIWGGIQAVGGFFLWLWQVAVVPAWNAICAAFMWAWSIISPVLGWIATGLTWLGAILFVILVVPFMIAWNLIVAAAQFAWSALTAIWNGIAAVASWLWFNALAPIFSWIGAAWGVLCAGIGWVWENILAPVWNAVAAAAGWLWNAVLSGIFAAIGMAWNGLLVAMDWVWNNILKPAWDAVAAAAGWLWNNVLLPIFSAIGAVWNAELNGMKMIWDTVLKPCWDALAAAAGWLWNNVLAPIFGAIGAAWNGLMVGIRAVYDNVLVPCFDALKAAVAAVGDAFKAAVDWIGNVWNTIRGILARPVNFMINVVYNNGIKAAWDKVAGWLSLPPLPPMSPIQEFATGGKVRGSGSGDTVPAWLTPGEYIISKPVVDYWGLENIDRAHRATATRQRGGKKGRQEGLMATGYQAGGVVAIERAMDFAKSMNGKPYIFGGSSEAGTDCSGYMAMIKRALLDERPYARREWATETGMPPPGFVPGMSSGFSIGVKHGGSGGGHTAGTLGGMLGLPAINVEAGGSHHNVAFGGPAVGADSGQFPEKYRIPFLNGAFVSGGGGGGGMMPNPMAVMAHAAKHFISDPIRALIEGGLNLLLPGSQEPGTWKSGARGTTFKIFDSVIDWVDRKIDEIFPPIFGGGGGGVASANPNVVAAVRETAAQFGWGQGPQWDALSWIIGKESSWDPTKKNPTSSAAGLFQKMTSVHGALEPTPGGQALWGLNYIRGRYGDPLGAKAFWESHGYYDQGGWLPPGWSLAYNGTGQAEAVLTGEQIDQVERYANSGSGTTINVRTQTTNASPERIAASIDRHLTMYGRV